MTFQQLRDGLSKRDIVANDLMDRFMVVGQDGYWKVNSRWNKMVYRFIRRFVLAGRDPLDRILFWAKCLDENLLTESIHKLEEEVMVLKVAYNN